MRLLATALLCLLMPLSSLAQVNEWSKTRVRPGEYAIMDLDDTAPLSALVPPHLDVRQCSELEMGVDLDVLGTQTAGVFGTYHCATADESAFANCTNADFHSASDVVADRHQARMPYFGILIGIRPAAGQLTRIYIRCLW